MIQEDDEVSVTVKNRRRKRKKKIILEEDEILHADVGDEISKVAEPVSRLPHPPTKKSTITALEAPPEDNQKEEFEGGDEDNVGDDKIKPYDYSYKDALAGGSYNPALFEDGNKNNIFDDTLKPKKRKKKIMRKKKKKKPGNNDSTLNDTGTHLADFSKPIFNPTKADSPKLHEETKNPGKGNIDDTHSGEFSNYVQDFNFENNEHANDYSVTFFKKSLIHGWRFTNLAHSYDDTLTRVMRLLVLYNQIFYIFFITGIVFYSSGHTTEVDGISGYAAFGISLLLVAIERIIHMVVIALLTKFNIRKPNTVKYNLTEDEEDEFEYEENFRRTNMVQSHADMNATSSGFRKTNEHPFADNYGSERPNTAAEKDEDEEKRPLGLLLLIGITVCFMLFFWIFIFMMSLNYSTRGGFLWAICFGWHIIITFLFVEPFYVFVISILIFRKGWKSNEII